MCYVSAEGRSRNAIADEVLVVRRQPHGSNWLVSPELEPFTKVTADGHQHLYLLVETIRVTRDLERHDPCA